jgi:hypothetical protein
LSITITSTSSFLCSGRPRKRPADGEDIPKVAKKRGRKPKTETVAAAVSSDQDSSEASEASSLHATGHMLGDFGPLTPVP